MIYPEDKEIAIRTHHQYSGLDRPMFLSITLKLRELLTSKGPYAFSLFTALYNRNFHLPNLQIY